MTKQIFQPGDRVKFGEIEGDLGREIIGILRLYREPIGRYQVYDFDEQGRLTTMPEVGCLLTLIERPKKKVKKRIEGWINFYPNNRYPNNFSSEIFSTKEAADESAGSARLGEAHHIVHEWEEEKEKYD